MPHAVRYVFAGLFIVASIFFITYMYRRLIREVTDSKWVRFAGGAALVTIFAGGFFGRFFFRGSPSARGFAAFLALWFGLILYTLLSLIIVDAVRGLLKLRALKKNPAAVDAPPEQPERRVFIARAAAATALAGGAGFGGFGIYRAFAPPRITEVAVKLPGLPRAFDGFTIAHLSDTHIGAVLQTQYVDELVRRANSFKPDLVAITGDLVDGTPAELGQFVARLRNLSSRFGTWFCSGNHDHYSGWEGWATALAGMDFTVLRNQHKTIVDGDARLDLIGVEDYGSRWIPGGYDLTAALLNRDPSVPSILLSHQPGTFDDTVKAQLGLQLSGHTHGGQTFPGTGIASLMWGSRTHGLSREGNSQLFVSRGCGFVGPAMRLGSPPEVVKLVLTPA